MLRDAKGNIPDSRNRQQRRLEKQNQRHKIYTKNYPSKRSYLRSVDYIREQSLPLEDEE